MVLPTTIDEVLKSLDAIIVWSKKNNSRIGYFAVLYRQMTLAVKMGIINKAFEDGKRMEQLDVIFANRYITAWNAYQSKKPCSNSWCAAFDACKTVNLVVLQHLILGINTHINLDLSIAAAECCPGAKITGLKNDFNKINDVIADLSNSIQENLSNIWPPLHFLQKIANNREEAVLNFSITSARKTAWANALILANADPNAKAKHIKIIDDTVFKVAGAIQKPGFTANLMLKPVLFMESKNIASIITMLEKENKKVVEIKK